MNDRVAGLISILASIVLLVTLKGVDFATSAFPAVLLVVLIVLSVCLIIKSDRKKYDFSNIKSVVIVYIMFIIYVLLLQYIGFVISTTCFISAFLFYNKYSMKKYMIIIVSFIIAFVIWFIFYKLFGISLPEILF